MRTLRTISLLVALALTSCLVGQAQNDFVDDAYYIPGDQPQASPSQSQQQGYYYDETPDYYSEDDAIDAYNRQGQPYKGQRGNSLASQGQPPKQGIGQYSKRISRFHNPATIYIYDSGDVDVYYNGDGTYSVYSYPDRYDYVQDRYNPIGITVNLWSPGWYSSWDYYYDHMRYSSWYPWYSNRYPYPYSWGGYGYWGPSVWYTHPWSWGSGAWYGYGWPHRGYGYGHGYGHGYHDGFWDGYYAGIYDPYYGRYVDRSTYYSDGRLGSSYYDRSNPRATDRTGTLSGNARRSSNADRFAEVKDRGEFWKNDSNRRLYNENGRSARGSYDSNRGINSQNRTTATDRTISANRNVNSNSRSARGSYYDNPNTVNEQGNSSSTISRQGSTGRSINSNSRSARGSYQGSTDPQYNRREMNRSDAPVQRGGYFNEAPQRRETPTRSYNSGTTSRRGSYGNSNSGSYNSRSRSSSVFNGSSSSSSPSRSSSIGSSRSSSVRSSSSIGSSSGSSGSSSRSSSTGGGGTSARGRR